MNKVFKIVWSKVKNCYVVTSELAKSHTKAPKSCIFSRAMVSGILLSFLSYGNAFADYGYPTGYTPFESTYDSATGADMYFAGSDGNYIFYQFAKGGNYDLKYQLIVRKNINTGDLAYYLLDNSLHPTSNEYFESSLSEVQSVFGSDIANKIVAATGGTGSISGAVTTMRYSDFVNTHENISVIDSDYSYTGESGDWRRHNIIGQNTSTGAIEVWSYDGDYVGTIDGGTSGKVYTMAGGSGASGGTGSDPNAIYNMTASGNTITYTKGNGYSGSVTLAGGGGGSSLEGPFIYHSDMIDMTTVTDTGTGEFPIQIKDKNNLDYGGMKVVQYKDFNNTNISTFGLEHFLSNSIGESATYLGMKIRTDGTSNDTLIHGLGDSVLLGTDDFSLVPMGGKTVGIGSNAKPLAVNSIAFGADSSVASTAANSVALGSGSTATDANVVSVGNGTLNRRIVNLADAINTFDAVNLGQMQSYIKPASNGQFIRTTNTGGQNLTALDTAAKNSVTAVTVDGNMLVYHRGDNTSVSVALPTGGTQQAGNNKSRVTTVGSVTAFASNSTPDGYLLCDGRAVSRTKYADLFAKIGTTYGAGNGSTTFNLPNLVNRFVEGSNASGQYMEAGLPNITGKTGGSGVNSDSPAATGAFYKYGTGLGVDDHDYDNHMVAFDASRSNAIYGKSNTVQPEALKMQYYIKVDNSGSGEMPYVGIKSSDGGVNEWGDGATGADSIALGKGTSATAAGSVSIGYNSVANSANTVSVGSSSLKRKIVNVADGTAASDVSTFGQLTAEQNARIAAVNAEAATRLEEDTKLSNRIGTLDTDGNYIKKSSEYTVYQNLGALDDRARLLTRNLNTESVNRQNADIDLNNRLGTMADNGYFIEASVPVTTNLYNIDNQLYQATQDLLNEIHERTEAVAAVSDKIGFLDETGGILESTDSVSQNLLRLESAVKSANATLDNVVVYDDSSFSRVSLRTLDGTVIDNVAAGSLSPFSKEAVNGSQLYATNQNIAGFAADIQRNKENIRELNQSVSTALESVSSSSILVDTINGLKADASLNNLTSAGKQVIATAAANAVQEYIAANGVNSSNAVPPMAPMISSNPNTLHVTDAGNGSLHVGEGSYVNGTSSIAIGVGNQVNANNSGAFGDPSIINADESYVLGNDDTVNIGATGSFIVGNDSVSDAKGGLSLGSNNKLQSTASDSVLLGNRAVASGKNSVALGSGSVASVDNVVSLGNENLRRKVTYLMDGTLVDGSSDAVTGHQLFETNEKVRSLFQSLDTKVNADASNADVDAWRNKLAGSIMPNDNGFVRGDDVFTALMMSVNDTIGYNTTNNTIHIGGVQRYDDVDVVDVSKSDGSTRVITGVATNPKDISFAANVGYVNAVGDALLGAVNTSLERIDTRVNRIGANAAAMSALTPASFEGDEKWSLAASVGNYRSASAGAVGAFYKPAENVMMNVRGSFGNDENMVAAGVAVSLNKGDVPGVTKRQLANTVNAQAGQLQQQNQMISMQAGEIQQLKGTVSEMRDQIQLLTETIHELKSKVNS